MRCIQLTFDPFADIGRLLYRRQTLLEHELCNSSCGRNLHLTDLGLTREQHAPGAKFRPHLVGACLRRDVGTAELGVGLCAREAQQQARQKQAAKGEAESSGAEMHAGQYRSDTQTMFHRIMK